MPLLAIWETMRPPETHGKLLPSIGTHTSVIFPLMSTEDTLLKDKSVFTGSQLLEVDDLTGHLTTDENRV
jgi:hypothetical protein